MNSEIQPKTEWTCFNDERITSVEGNWASIIETCVEYSCYPTVLFYEKLDPDEEYDVSRDFRLYTSQLENMIKIAREADRLNSSSIEELYSHRTIEEQKQIEQEISMTRKKSKESEIPEPVPFKQEDEERVFKEDIKAEQEQLEAFKRANPRVCIYMCSNC